MGWQQIPWNIFLSKNAARRSENLPVCGLRLLPQMHKYFIFMQIKRYFFGKRNIFSYLRKRKLLHFCVVCAKLMLYEVRFAT